MTLIVNAPLPRRLKIAREITGLDQTAFGRLIGVSRPTMNAFETGVREPSFSQVVAWARLSGQDLNWLAEGVGYTPRDSNPEPSD